MTTLILGSSSKARIRLLKQLHIPFSTQSPDIDESQQPKESVDSLVRRLAKQKALAVGSDKHNALIIGGDQVLCVNNQILGKPLTREYAEQQLRQCSGQPGTFHSAICLHNTDTKQCHLATVCTQVLFRELCTDLIAYYLHHADPLHCAGSFKAEDLGVLLCKQISSDDPYAIQGLPLLTLISMLHAEKFALTVGMGES